MRTDDSDYLLIQDNEAHTQRKPGIIASKRCDHLTIRSIDPGPMPRTASSCTAVGRWPD